MLPFVLANSGYFWHWGPAGGLLLLGLRCNLLTTGGRASLCFKRREIPVRAVNGYFFFYSKCKPCLMKEIIASTPLFKSAVQNFWMSKHFKGLVAVLDPLL